MQAVEELTKAIARANRNWPSGLSRPVATQLLNSMGGEAVAAVVSDLQVGEDGLIGRVILFTERLVVFADIKDIARGGDPQWPLPAKWSTSVSLLPRSAVSQIDVLSPVDPPTYQTDWVHLAAGTRVVLRYEGLEDSPIEVTERNTSDLEALLTLVRSDLGRISCG